MLGWFAHYAGALDAVEKVGHSDLLLPRIRAELELRNPGHCAVLVFPPWAPNARKAMEDDLLMTLNELKADPNLPWTTARVSLCSGRVQEVINEVNAKASQAEAVDEPSRCFTFVVAPS